MRVMVRLRIKIRRLAVRWSFECIVGARNRAEADE